MRLVQPVVMRLAAPKWLGIVADCAADPLQCKMSRPPGLTADAAGFLQVTDSEAHRIRVLK